MTVLTNLRNQRQEEFSQVWLYTQFGILYLCPRFGKIRTALLCMAQMNNPKVLIIYPLDSIRKSWEDDIVKWDYPAQDIEYASTAILWKLAETPKIYDLIIVDEIHDLSEANRKELKMLLQAGNKAVLGLSGTISAKTEKELLEDLQMPILATYSIEQGIAEKVITDYEITVIELDLDNTVRWVKPSKAKEFYTTEKARYEWLTTKIESIRNECNEVKERIRAGENLKWPDVKKQLGFLPLQRMALLKKSLAKRNLTSKLLKSIQERVLVFCGTIEIADSFGYPTYHSGNKNKQVRDDFCTGIGNCLITVDMFEAGVTIKPINLAIISSFDSNPENLGQRISRLTGFEYDNPEKTAKIFILCTNTVEKDWLKEALAFFDSEKIKYISDKSLKI